MKLAERTLRGNPYVPPVGRSLFGWRIHPITGLRQFHYGEDYITSGHNWPVYALENGIVKASNWDDINGNHIWVEYPRIDLKVFYGHLKEKYVVYGQSVTSDTVIGLVGTTGRSQGEHLHMGVKHISSNQYFDHHNYQWEMFQVNGHWDEQFTRDLQYFYGSKIDGIISGQLFNRKNVQKVKLGVSGSLLVKKLQADAGVRQSGQLDVVTIKALQKKYGTPQDGIISETSSLVKSMQTKMKEEVQ